MSCIEIMAQASQDRIRSKVNQVRQMVKNASNEQIVLVLQYYENEDNDVARTIAAFLEDNAKEALQQWHFSGVNKTTPAKRHKKKKKKQKSVGVTENGDAPSSLNDSAELSSVASTPQGDAPPLHTSTTAVNGCSDQQTTDHGLPNGMDKQETRPAADPVRIDVSKGGMPNGVVDVATKVMGASSKGSRTRPTSLEYQQQNKKEYQQHNRKGRDRKSSADADTTELDGPTDSFVATEQRVSSAGKRPHTHTVLEKSCKDLHRQTVSLERLRIVLGENVDKAFKRVNEVFRELHDELNKREEVLVAELTAAKLQANQVLSDQQDRASSLKQQTERAHAMSEKDVTQLRSDIKQFVCDRKLYEDLSLEQRFTCNVGELFNEISHFGAVASVKLGAASTRRMSSVDSELSRQNSETTPSMTTPTPTANTKRDVSHSTNTAGATSPTVGAVTTTELHIVTQSDSLTQYEMESKHRLGDDRSESSMTKPSDGPRTSARHDGGRGRASPRRGVRPSVRGHSSRGGRTFFARNVSHDGEPDVKHNAAETDGPRSETKSSSTSETTAANDVTTDTSSRETAVNNSGRNSARGGRSQRMPRDGRGRGNWYHRNGYRKFDSDHVKMNGVTKSAPDDKVEPVNSVPTQSRNDGDSRTTEVPTKKSDVRDSQPLPRRDAPRKPASNMSPNTESLAA